MKRKVVQYLLVSMLTLSLVGCAEKETGKASIQIKQSETKKEDSAQEDTMQDVEQEPGTETDVDIVSVIKDSRKRRAEALEQDIYAYDELFLGGMADEHPEIEKDGVVYEIYEQGVVCTIKDQNHRIQETIEYEGNSYPVYIFIGTYGDVEFEEFTFPEQFKCVVGNINAKNLVIPDTVEHFEIHCGEKLETIVMPEYLPCYTAREFDYMFDGCINLESMEVPYGAMTLKGTFRGCTNLNTVKLPDTLRSLMDETFRDCTSLKEIEIPEKVLVIGDYCFENCENLTSISLPNYLGHIGESAFSGCRRLEELIIPDFPECKGDVYRSIIVVFKDMPNLKKLVFPRELEELQASTNVDYDGAFIFEGCDSLEMIAFPVSMTPEEFEHLVSLPESIKTVEVPEALVSSFQERFPGVEVLVRQ